MTTAGTPAVEDAALRTLRAVWSAFAGVVAVAGLVVPLVASDPGTTVPAVLPVALALAATLGALAGTLALDRGLAAQPPADDAAAVAELRTRLVLQVAIAEAPVLLAVALAFVLGPPWVPTVAAVPALVGLLLVRPSPRRLDRFDAAWRARGADVSLRRALLDTSPR